MTSEFDPSKLNLEFSDSQLKDTASAVTPVESKTNSSGTLPKTVKNQEEREEERQSESSKGDSVGWVYYLKKQQLIDKLQSCGLDTSGKTDDLRKRFIDFWRQSNSSSSGQQPFIINAATPLIEEAISVREILGLSPNADANMVKRVLSSVVNTTSYNTDATTTLQSTENIRFPAQSMATDTRVTFANQEPLRSSKIPPVTLVNTDREIRSVYDSLTVPSIHNPYGNSGMQTRHELGYGDMAQHANCEIRSAAYPLSYTDSAQNANRQIGNVIHPINNTNQNYNRSDTARVCDMVRKWNISYDGNKNPITFLERLGELIECYNVDPDDIIKALPEVLKEKALLWYRNHRELWRNFADFQQSFELQYLPPGYHKNLDDEIRLRTQGEDEPFRDFAVAILTLIRRRGGYSLQEKVDRMYQNMKPDYKRTMRSDQYHNIQDLIRDAEHYESYERAKRLYRPPPNPSQTLVPEAAYYSKNRVSKPLNRVDTLNFRSDFRRPEIATPHRSDEQRQFLNQMRFPNPSPGQQRSFYNGQNSNQAPRGPNQNAVTLRTSQVPRTETTEHRPVNNYTGTCWNCEEEGHRTFQCTKPTVIRCFYCKKGGIRTVHCPCRQGNDRRPSD